MMTTRTTLTTIGLVDPAYARCGIKLTRHMAAIWNRHDLRHRFHLNSDKNRLAFVAWYVIDFLPGNNFPLTELDPAILTALNAPVSAYGPMTVFLHEVWRERFAQDHEYNIHTESGYFNFASVVIYDYATRGGVIASLISDGFYTFCHRPGLWDGIHLVSKVAAAFHQRTALYNGKYHLHDWSDREAFNFDLLVHFYVRNGNRFAIAPETMRYWADAASKSDKRISRFALACVLLSDRWDLANPEDVFAHANAVVDWIRSEVFVAFLATQTLIPGVEPQRSEAGDLDEEARSRLRREYGIAAMPGDSEEVIDVLVIGPFSAASGLGTGTRRSVEALESLNVRLRIIDFMFDNPSAATENVPEHLQYRGEQPKLTLWHFNGEYIADAMIAAPGLLNPERNVGYFFWETEVMPLNHQLGVDMVDEVWTPSEFVKHCYEGNGAPVVNVSTSVETPAVTRSFSRRHFGLKDGAFTFMFSFDGYSAIHRKNPAAVVKAFLAAFPNGDEDVELLLKAQNFATNHWIEINGRGEELLELIDSDPRITFINRTISLDELYWLKGNVDAYVSLHRSEGFGYGPAEAMALGRPVIMTNYSANVEFATPDGCLLADARIVPVLHGEYLYWRPEMTWAEVDVQHAATLMRDLQSGRIDGAKMGQVGAAYIKTNFGRQAMAARYEARLKQLGIEVPGDWRSAPEG